MQIQGAAPPKKFCAVLVPHLGEVSSEWAVSLKNMQCPDGTQVFLSRGMPIDVTREQMVKDILKEGFEWIFFLDSDVIMPNNTIPTLLSHNLPLVCGVYDAKKEGVYPAMWVRTKAEEKDAQGNITTKEAFGAVANWKGRMIKVDVIGCGCMLVHRSVFEKIRGKTDLPFFLWTKERNRELMKKMNLPDPLMADVSEDFYFCMLAKQYAGVDIVVDTDIRCGHIATMKLADGKAGIPGV